MLVLLACLGACGQVPTGEPAVLQLLGFSQSGGRGVRLNESLRFQFSLSLDRASITGSSFVIEDSAGVPVRGSIHQRARTLQFVPELPLRADLIDSGLLPGRTYTVRLLGFPAPDCIRGQGSEPLGRSYVFQFKTAGVGGDEAVFVPPISSGLPLVFDCKQRILEPLDKIVLQTVEGIDPRSINDSAFELIPAQGSVEVKYIALRARLSANRSDYAEVVLRPIIDRSRPDSILALDPGEYYLAERSSRTRFSTLGGIQVAPVWSVAGDPFLKLQVVQEKLKSMREEFDQPGDIAPILAEGVDGMAFLDGAGEVRVRFPAAAGTGVDGLVSSQYQLDQRQSDPPPLDLHGTLLQVPEGETLDLSEFSGTVILRAQKGMLIDGNLRRRAFVENAVEGQTKAPKSSSQDTSARQGGNPGPSLEEWIDERERELRRALQAQLRLDNDVISIDPTEIADPDSVAERLDQAQRAMTLTQFLSDAVEAEVPWTILVTGGDALVQGSIDVDGELLIVAGGWLRVPGSVSAGAVWATPGGGGDFGAIQDVPHKLPLTLDPPPMNPLLEDLRVAVVSRSIRPQGGVEDWLRLDASGEERSGQIRLRAIGKRELGERSVENLGPVDEISLLRGCASLRVVVELIVPASARPGTEPWDPPHLDAVEITWKATGGDRRP